MTKQVRIQFELPENKVRELEQLMEESGTATRKDLFNNALTLLEWALNESKRGNVIASINEQEHKYEELHMPILSAVAGLNAPGEKRSSAA